MGSPELNIFEKDGSNFSIDVDVRDNFAPRPFSSDFHHHTACVFLATMHSLPFL
jgi:hypothetical protein